MKRYFFLFSVVLSSCGLAAQAENPDLILGVWKSSSEGLMIKIDKVGNNFQGRIVWLEHGQSNQPMLDDKNPDARLRRMPLKGNKIIKELKFNADKSIWEGGTYYNHKEGKLYNCEISLQPGNKIQITKYIQNHQDGLAETWIRQ